MKRGGRPRIQVEESTALITQRVRQLVDTAHGGNVHEASKVTGVPSATLRALYNGRSVNPGLKTLQALGKPYGFEPGWFSDAETSRHVPKMGIDVKQRKQDPSGSYHVMRNVGIPWSAWPMPGVFSRLKAHVVSLPRGEDRPLIGDLDPDNPTDAVEVDWEVAKFLLGPLLKEEKAFGLTLLPEFSHNAHDQAVIQRMRLLGLFWQEALKTLLGAEESAGGLDGAGK